MGRQRRVGSLAHGPRGGKRRLAVSTARVVHHSGIMVCGGPGPLTPMRHSSHPTATHAMSQLVRVAVVAASTAATTHVGCPSQRRMDHSPAPTRCPGTRLTGRWVRARPLCRLSQPDGTRCDVRLCVCVARCTRDVADSETMVWPRTKSVGTGQDAVVQRVGSAVLSLSETRSTPAFRAVSPPADACWTHAVD